MKPRRASPFPQSPPPSFPPEEGPTKVPCPACKWTGLEFVHDDRGRYSTQACGFCKGSRVVLPAQRREWLATHRLR